MQTCQVSDVRTQTKAKGERDRRVRRDSEVEPIGFGGQLSVREKGEV